MGLSTLKSGQNLSLSISPWRVLQSNGRMEPVPFCRRWYGVDHYDADAIVAYELGKRSQYVRLLSIVLSVREGSVNNWGKDFVRMPVMHQTTLGYADFIRRVARASDPQKDSEVILDKLLNLLQSSNTA